MILLLHAGLHDMFIKQPRIVLAQIGKANQERISESPIEETRLSAVLGFSPGLPVLVVPRPGIPAPRAGPNEAVLCTVIDVQDYESPGDVKKVLDAIQGNLEGLVFNRRPAGTETLRFKDAPRPSALQEEVLHELTVFETGTGFTTTRQVRLVIDEAMNGMDPAGLATLSASCTGLVGDLAMAEPAAFHAILEDEYPAIMVPFSDARRVSVDRDVACFAYKITGHVVARHKGSLLDAIPGVQLDDYFA